ncbi:hypothetical protein D3C78_469720 [compost metagenome]
MHVLDARQADTIARLGTRQRPQRALAQDAVAWLVALAGLLLAPGTERAHHGQLLAIETPGQLDLAPGVLRVVHLALGGDQFGAIFQQPGTLVGAQSPIQLVIDLAQVLDILGGVAHLHLAQRTLQPVGTGFVLRQLDAQQLLDQARVAHGEADVQVTGGDLGVEQRLRQAAGQAPEHFQILAAGVQHLDHGRIVQQCGEGRPVANLQRIDQPYCLAVADLQQRRDRIEGVDPHELGIQGNERPTAPGTAAGGKGRVVQDPADIDSGHGALLQKIAL